MTTTLEEGQYYGSLVGAETISSRIKSTPGISLKFRLDGDHGYADLVIWITEGGADIALRDLETLGWDGDFDHPKFSRGEGVSLSLQYERAGKYEGRPQWRIGRAGGPPPESSDPVLARFAARFKSRRQAPTPMSGAPMPVRRAHGEAAPPAPPAPPAPARPPAPAPAAPPHASTLEEAWAVWQQAEAGDDVSFWAMVQAVAGHQDDARVTPAEWQQVASGAPPF
jgi:hypothetical protein